MTQSSTLTGDISVTLKSWAADFERILSAMLEPAGSAPSTLVRAVRYSVQSGGKRVRAFIVTRLCELCGGTPQQAAPAAVAMECVHAFSLVHDDLPAMDDDDVRRGRPTTHREFGEAVAILAGDALLALAFELLTTRINDPRIAAAAVAELARGTGWAGMIGGQTIDIESESLPPDLELVQRIHRGKTARLFESSGRLGAICAAAPADRLEAAGRFGFELGRAFQIADDILDVTGTADRLGKAVAKDAGAGKQTYPAAAGLEASRTAAARACENAIQALAIFGPPADDLRALARYVVERDH
jgi:farnesyl diphosphate synthase